MRLFEAIVDANHRAVAGDANAGLHPGDYESELPVIALTCIDVRLNPLLPQVLGLPPEHFIWLRNAGNIITGPLSSTMRSLALACAVKGGKEIAIIGHSDCQVSKTTTLELVDKLRTLGVERQLLPANLNEYFGLFASPEQNVLKAAGIARSSPLIGPKVPIHGLLLDLATGRVEWLVNGYTTAASAPTGPFQPLVQEAAQSFDALKNLAEFKIGEMKFPEAKIGELASQAENWVSQHLQGMDKPPAQVPAPPPASPAPPPKIPLPPPIRPRMRLRKSDK